MPEYTVRVTQPLRGGGRRVFERFATDAAGQFSFTELHAGEYRVEVLDGEEVIGNTSVSLIDGSMRASGVMVSTEINATRGPGWWGRRSTGAKAGIIGGIAAAVVLALIYESCVNGRGGPCG